MASPRPSQQASARIALACLLLVLAACSASPTRRPEAGAARLIDYFPASYEESRFQFRKACQEAVPKGSCSEDPIDSATDRDLTVDYAYFTQDYNKSLLVIQSGIHGVEGYAGAAVQQLVLHEYLDPLLARGFDVLLIHALDPWGFKHNRRTDEWNVNLNRNFSDKDSIDSSHNEGYANLRGTIEPSGPVGNVTFGSLGIELDLIGAVIANGLDDRSIRDALDEGQHQFGQGLNFGGRTHQQQTDILAKKLGPLFDQHPGRKLFLDVHTGLGDARILHIITGKKRPPAVADEQEELFGSMTGDGVELTSPDSPGFFPTEGDVIDFVPTLSNDSDRVLAATMEYGTMGTGMLPQLRSASRMILENQAYFHKCSQESVCQEVRANFLELFNPSDLAWRTAVLTEARQVLSALTKTP